MNIKSLRTFLLYSLIINYILLIVWFLIERLPHMWAYHLSCDGMLVSFADFDRIMLTGLVFYKMFVIFFNLVPCVVLYLIKPQQKDGPA